MESSDSADLVLRLAPCSDVDELRVMLEPFAQGGILTEAVTKEFSGHEFAEFILQLSPSISVAAFARVLTTWIRAKSPQRTVKMNGVELINYDAEDTERIVQAVERIVRETSKRRQGKKR